ncbi:MAG: uroporphyrinogen-III C-methyltransferase [Legionellales bacterium]
MKSIKWWFPILIVIMGIILWRVYIDMPKTSTAQLPLQNTPQITLEQLSQQQTQLLNRVDQLQTQVHQVSQVLTLPEIYYYLNIANVHLTLLNDVKTSLNIMRFVQTRLKNANAPAALQEALTADLSDLELIAQPQYAYVNQKITEIQNQVNTLPLRPRQNIMPTETATTQTGWRLILHNTWGELKSLIRIQPRNASIDYVLFDETILRETVRVELQRASIASVLGQTDLYQSSLLQAGIALEQFFDQDSADVQQARATLDNLRQLDIVPRIPKADRALVWLQTQEQQGNQQ